jgi:glycine/D-amino acid oxidase-like deaminating enzyme
MRVVICGGGVIAACTAYFLARRGIEVMVVERAEVACAASGKAGGFLALDWCAGSALDALARRSFALHARLVSEIGGDWAYRRMNAYGGYVVADGDARRRAPSRLGWLREGVVISSQLGDSQTTAIVHPRKFTLALMRAAQDHGAQLWSGRVTGLLRGETNSVVSGVDIDGEPLAADATVIAMGPWSILAAQWLPLPAVFGQQSPSLVYDTGTSVPADALFLEYREDSGEELSVEVFPRADGSTHVTAFSSQDPLPLDPAQIAPEPDAIARLQVICERLSPAFQSDRIFARQACFRPVTQDFLPMIGRVPAVEGAYIATGHNVWGILNAPATGEAMSELIADGTARGTDLTPFDPARLGAVDPARVRANVIR